jgi:hypothetical protein
MTDAPDFPEIEVATKALIAAIEAAARALPPGDGADALKAERRLVRRYRKAVEDINNGVWAAITQKQNSAREKKADGKRARVAAEHAAWMKEHAAWMAMTDEQKAAERARIDAIRESMRREAEERRLAEKENTTLESKIVSAGYKALAAKLHPDVGGSDDAMQRLNQARDKLKGKR